MVTYNVEYLRAITRESFAKRDIHCFSNKNLNVSVYENAYVLPYKEMEDSYHIYAGIVSTEGEYLEQSAFHEKIGKAYPFSKEKVHIIEEPVIYIGVIENCWGHVITDALKKVWYIRTTLGNECLQMGGVKLFMLLDLIDHWQPTQ